MKETLLSILKILFTIALYSVLFWVSVNPALRYFGAKPMQFVESVSIFASIIIIILFIKEL